MMGLRSIIDAHDLSTTSIREDVWGCDVTWRRQNIDHEHYFETDGPSGLKWQF